MLVSFLKVRLMMIFEYALDAYSKFLYNNLIAELKAEFPLIEDIIRALQRVYTGLLSQFEFIPIESFYKIVQTQLEREETRKLIKSLMENNYLVAIVKRNHRVITSYNDLVFADKERIFKLFKKNEPPRSKLCGILNAVLVRAEARSIGNLLYRLV